MKLASQKACAVGILFLFLAAPFLVHAQYGGRGSSTYRSKISKLDSDRVDDLPIPILFGVKLSMITPNFGDPRDGGDRTHEGEDILALKGTPIVSPTEAVVIQTGSGASSGNYVTTANPGGETFVYMHLSRIIAKRGDELDVGDLIGYVGNTGNASGGPTHLHFEIRKSRKATDPFPRITKEFSLEDKIDYLDRALNDLDSDDVDDLIDFVVENYSGELWQAKNAGIELSKDLEKALAQAPVVVPVDATAPGDLTLNSQGPLVTTLQSFLIAKDTGPAAKALAVVGATGFFGPITQRALIEYQVASDITPASGYFGPKTRAYMLAQAM